MEPKKKLTEQKAKKKSQRKLTPSKTPNTKSSQAKAQIEITSWLEKILFEGKIEKASEYAQQLPKSYQLLARDLIQAVSSKDAKPGNGFRVELLSSGQLTKLIKVTQSPYFLVGILCNNSTSRTLRQEIIMQLASLNLDHQIHDYLRSQLQRIKDSEEQTYCWNLILEHGVYKSATLKSEAFNFLEWGINRKIKPVNRFQYLFNLGLTEDDFVQIDKSKKSRLLQKFLEIDPAYFWGFIILIGKKSILHEDLDRYLGKEANNALIAFFEHRKDYSGPWLTEFEQKFLVPLLKSHADQLMTFDAVLPFVKYLDYYRTLALEEWLVRAVKRSFGRGDDLAQLLSDKRVPELSRELETMRSRNIENETSNRELKAKVKQLETQVAEYKQAVENYENRLRESMRAEASSTSADLSRTKAEVIKSLIESLDGILDGPQGSDLERSLQRLGISRLGKTGSDYVWDTDTCETLLGDAIETGIVVRSGYTWLDGSKKVLIRRVLLKAKIVS